MAELSREDCEDVCWICLEATRQQEELIKPCSCPRLVHKRCLAKWQLQSAGKSEETTCRFCKQTLPSWKETLTPKNLKLAAPVVSVHFHGQVYRLRVRPGPEGQREFQHELQKISGLSELECMQVTFQCKAPEQAEVSKDLRFKGMAAFDAAMYCASLSAAERRRSKNFDLPEQQGSAARATTHRNHHIHQGQSPTQQRLYARAQHSRASTSDIPEPSVVHRQHNAAPSLLSTWPSVHQTRSWTSIPQLPEVSHTGPGTPTANTMMGLHLSDSYDSLQQATGGPCYPSLVSPRELAASQRHSLDSMQHVSLVDSLPSSPRHIFAAGPGNLNSSSFRHTITNRPGHINPSSDRTTAPSNFVPTSPTNATLVAGRAVGAISSHVHESPESLPEVAVNHNSSNTSVPKPPFVATYVPAYRHNPSRMNEVSQILAQSRAASTSHIPSDANDTELHLQPHVVLTQTTAAASGTPQSTGAQSQSHACVPHLPHLVTDASSSLQTANKPDNQTVDQPWVARGFMGRLKGMYGWVMGRPRCDG